MLYGICVMTADLGKTTKKTLQCHFKFLVSILTTFFLYYHLFSIFFCS